MKRIMIGAVLALGLLPVQFIQVIDPVTQQLIAAGLGQKVAASGWLLAPTSLEHALSSGATDNPHGSAMR